jgi:hypothetical protein
MWNPNPLSLWVWASGAGIAPPTPPDITSAFVDVFTIDRSPVARGVVFAVTHAPTGPPRRYFFRALTWLFGQHREPAHAR